MSKTLNLIFHGPLHKLHPGVYTIEADTVAEAISGFSKQTGLLNVNLGEDKHCLSVLGFDTKESLYSNIPDDVDTLHILPTMSGGKSGFFKVAIGVALIAVAAVSLGGFAAAFAAEGAWGLAVNIGVSLVLGGVLEMLSPAPKMDLGGAGLGGTDPAASAYLGASANTTRIGTRIPVLYGEHQMFGHFLSFNVDAKQLAI